MNLRDKGKILASGNEIVQPDSLSKTERDRKELAHVKNRYERMTLRDAEMELISAALTRNQGNVEKSCRQLGIFKRTMYEKLKKHNLSVKLWRVKKEKK